MRHRSRLAPVLGLAMSLIAGCAQAPANVPTPAAPQRISPQGGVPALEIPLDPVADVAPPCPVPVPVPIPPVLPRFVAFTARAWRTGSLFVYDDAIKDVYILNGALAGLDGYCPGGPSPFMLASLNPTFFDGGKVLFEFAGHVFYYDMIAEERVELACDGLPFGARPRISANGLLVYVNRGGTVTLMPFAPMTPYLDKPRVLTKLAAEVVVQNGVASWPDWPCYRPVADLDISADGQWIVASLNGKLYLYNVVTPQLSQLLPLGGPELGTAPGNVAHVAISPDGRLIAFTVCDGCREHLLVLDRQTGLIDPVPYANLGLGNDWASLSNPRFLGDGLFFEVCTPIGTRVWRYDMATEALNGLVILNNALGELGTDTLVSNP